MSVPAKESKRRALVATLAAVAASQALFAPLKAHGQDGRVLRLGWFWLLYSPMDDPRMRAIWWEHLARHGYVEGQNIEHRFIPDWNGDFERLNASIRELLAWKPDAIVSVSTLNTRILQRATTSVPIVFMNVADPVSAGFVMSLSRPGGNITGVSVHNLTLFPKRLQLIRELLPKARRVVLIVDSVFMRDGFPVDFYRGMHNVAASLGLELVEEDVAQSPGGFEEAFQKAARLRPDLIMPLGPWPSLRIRDPDFAKYQDRHRIPVLGFTPQVGGRQEGLVIQFGATIDEMNRLGADLLAQVLRGGKPADIPVVQQTNIDLVVNLKAAGELGIKVPASILKRADRVIE